MKVASKLILMHLFIPIAFAACGVAPPVEAELRAESGVELATPTPVETSPQVGVTATAPSGAAGAAPSPTAIPETAPTPTAARLQLEIVQSHTWTDRDGNVRAHVLLRNPYDYPVKPAFRARASLLDTAGNLMRDRELYFLDGISGGNGFFLPGETSAANACFTCETTPLTGEWGSVEFLSAIEDASGSWDYSTAVEAAVGNVSFSGDSPIFDIAGTVKNNSDVMLDRISVRVFVFDQQGNLVGAAEASAWDVGPGASVGFSGFGIGQAPDGSVTHEVTALGVNY